MTDSRSTSRRPRPVCMIVHAYYEEDARVRREAESLVRSGRPVDVFALRRPELPEDEVLDGVRVHRLPVVRHQGAGIATYLWEYCDFLVRAAFASTRAHATRHYAVAQVHTLPDFLIFAALPLRLAGVPTILDLHEAMPDFFRSRFPRAANRFAYAALQLQERVAVAMADAVVTVNDALGDRLLAMGVPPEKLTILLNSPSTALFDPTSCPERPFMADGTLRVVYAGALTPTYELDVLVDAIAHIRRSRPELPISLDIYGRGDATEPLREQAARLGLADVVNLRGRIPLDAVPGAIAAADVGIAPTRRDQFTDVSLSTKIFEYGAMLKPVVATRLPTVERYFSADSLITYDPGSAASLAAGILRLVDQPGERAGRIERTAARVAELGWEREAAKHQALVDRLAKGR